MEANRPTELGESLRVGKGFPTLSRVAVGYRLRRTALAVIALVAFGTAIAATTAAIEGNADAGVVVDSSGHVASVSTTGFAWRDGVRPGQSVVSASKADAVDGWSIETDGPSGKVISREAPVVTALHDTLSFALLGLAAGCLALVFLRSNREWALPASCLALVGSSVPLFLANQSISGPTLFLAALVPSIWASWRLRRRPLVAGLVAAGCAAALVFWVAAHFSGDSATSIDQVRRTIALGGTGFLMADRAMQNRPLRVGRVTTRQLIWVLGTGSFVAIGLGLVYFVAFPAPIVAIAIVLGLLAVQPLRAIIGRRLEMVLMADLREYIAADVVEEERGRLARELHDAPLQELSAAIRRLELVPEAQAETNSLHAVADALRSLAIDLRPPMLDDLGLGAALDFLAEQTTSAEVNVVAELVDSTGLEPASRPPAAVELAMYRIAREAVTNALQHAKATTVYVRAKIDMKSITLEVSDNGVGMARDATRRASGRGRLGLSSMRRRAQAIGAEISIDGSHGGTWVEATWRA
jgi:Signal transduction histidine kinase